MVDNRPEALQMKRLQEAASKSDRVKHLTKLQCAANEYTRRKVESDGIIQGVFARAPGADNWKGISGGGLSPAVMLELKNAVDHYNPPNDTYEYDLVRSKAKLTHGNDEWNFKAQNFDTENFATFDDLRNHVRYQYRHAYSFSQNGRFNPRARAADNAEQGQDREDFGVVDTHRGTGANRVPINANWIDNAVTPPGQIG